MAKITGTTTEKVFPIEQFLGLHENPDGDTKLKSGEASIMRNWRITRDRNLTKRPGSKTLLTISEGKPVRGLWTGYVNGRLEMLAACNGRMWRLWDAETFTHICEDLGEINTDNPVTFFPFENKVYTLNGKEYKEYNGTVFQDVVGYRPLISISNVPTGGGELLEGANKLNGARRLWFSPDGKSAEFVLPEQDLLSVDYVMDNATGDYIYNGLYETDLFGGKIRFHNIEEFEGDGEETEFTPTAQDVGKVTVYINGTEKKGDYTYDADNRIVSFTTAPANGATVSIEEKIAKSATEYFAGDGVTKTYTLKNSGIVSMKLTTDEGVELVKGTDYTETDGVITFTETPYFMKTITISEETVNNKTETFTGDGSNKDFFLQNQYISKIVVKVGGTAKTDNPGYAFDGVKVTFTTAPADGAKIRFDEDIYPPRGTNTIEIGYTAAATYRSDVCRMKFAELFSGNQDTRVFLYGDDTNEALYSSIDYWGTPRADYFPDLNEVAVGDENTAITGMIRHYGQLICFKEDSTWNISYGTITLADGNTEVGLFVTPVNKAIGNRANGQMCLILNNPRTLFGNDVYEWTNSSYYTSNLTRDERQAKRISDRIYATLKKFDPEECYCYDDNDNQEYYIVYGDKALVNNYAADAWYYYTGLDIRCMINFGKDVLFGTSDGRIVEFSSDYANDDGEAIDCYWESGSMDFNTNIQRKYTSEMWIVTKPTSRSFVQATCITDKKSEYTTKDIHTVLFDFANVDFSDFTFDTNRMPKSTKLKIKAKKFTYYKLKLITKDKYAYATVLSATLKIRYTGYVK